MGLKKRRKKIASVRFFPWWDQMEVRQVVGLIQMINEIVKLDPTVSNLVEIGTHIGEATTIFLGFSNFKKIYCVDPFIISPYFEELFNKRLSKYFGVRCFPIRKTSEDYVKDFNEPLDMVYIDGDHSYESVQRDLKLWYNKLRANGFLCGHDYSDLEPESKLAIDEFISANELKLRLFEDWSWYVQKKGPTDG